MKQNNFQKWMNTAKMSYTTSISWSTKERKYDKLNFIKVKIFTLKIKNLIHSVKKRKRQATHWNKISTNHISTIEFIATIYKEFSEFNYGGKKSNIFYKCEKVLNRHLPVYFGYCILYFCISSCLQSTHLCFLLSWKEEGNYFWDEIQDNWSTIS